MKEWLRRRDWYFIWGCTLAVAFGLFFAWAVDR